MECTFGDRGNRIRFEIPTNAPDILDQLAFIVIISLRYNGEISDPSKFKRGDGKRWVGLEMKFSDFEHWSDARAHCSGHLDERGCVNRSYVGALERADPGLRMARTILAEIEKTNR